MPEDVIPRREARRHGQRPLPTLVDHLLGRPDLGRVVYAFGLDLDPLEGRLDGLAAVAVARGHVPENRAISTNIHYQHAISFFFLVFIPTPTDSIHTLPSAQMIGEKKLKVGQARKKPNSRMRPLVRPPRKRQAPAGLDRRADGPRRRVLVAVDVGGGVFGGLDEADVEVLGVPACDVGEGSRVDFLVVVVDCGDVSIALDGEVCNCYG